MDKSQQPIRPRPDWAVILHANWPHRHHPIHGEQVRQTLRSCIGRLRHHQLFGRLDPEHCSPAVWAMIELDYRRRRGRPSAADSMVPTIWLEAVAKDARRLLA